MSSAWWLGQRCVLSLASLSRTTENLRRTGECVLNLPSAAMAGQVDRIPRATRSDPVPEGKVRRGYRHVAEKFATAGLTLVSSLTLRPPRALECPVQLEAVLETDTGWRIPIRSGVDAAWCGRSASPVRMARETHLRCSIPPEARSH